MSAARPLPRCSRLWLPVAWTGVGALVGSGACELAKWPGPFPPSDYVISEHNILPILFALCLISFESGFRRSSLSVWFAAACMCVLAAVIDLPWGDVVVDANPAGARQFFVYSLLSDALFAFGSVAFLLGGIALIWTEWRERRARSAAGRD